MRHRNRGKILKRKRNQRNSLLIGLAKSLIEYGKIDTSEVKAKVLRTLVERLITRVKRGGLADIRQVHSMLGPKLSGKLINASERFSTRPGGYTRMVKIPAKRGDNSKRVLIELI